MKKFTIDRLPFTVRYPCLPCLPAGRPDRQAFTVYRALGLRDKGKGRVKGKRLKVNEGLL